MAVDFSLLPAETPVSHKGPSPFVWSIVFVVLTLAGIAFALWTWPRNAKTQTSWFWFTVVVIPVCLSGALVLRRFSHFYKWRSRAQSDNRLRKVYIDMVFDVASVPLAVLSAQYRLHVDEKENTFDAIVARSASLPTRPAKASREMIVASCLEPASAALMFNDKERQGAVLKWILRSFAPQIADVLDSVPMRIPIRVHLDITGFDLSSETILAVWDGLPESVRPSRLSEKPVIEPNGGLWLVDTMLDRTDPALRDVVTLLISANLSHLYTKDPEPGSAEAACMFMLCPAELAHKEKLSVAGWLHRPQSNTSNPPEGAMHYALKWGRTTGGAVGGTIQTGFDEGNAAQMQIALTAAGRSAAGSASSDFALETLVGQTGPTAPWLASALALDRAIASNAPYIVGVQDEAQVLLAVLAPAEQHTQQDVPKND
ncbi:hypothetical protein PTE30175_00927 [Pandoraea terrae]|uniref:Uncharacterized protein n=1 Tax=Pandoraea terrae TaxID=1537710 RepID=A0A5E4SRD9_9BURK|nr:hypothetical protein [Pandoraea terrae]VVD78310.1 hypothetical protein PTE30175_00927 [Pandoraea terrae]